MKNDFKKVTRDSPRQIFLYHLFRHNSEKAPASKLVTRLTASYPCECETPPSPMSFPQPQQTFITALHGFDTYLSKFVLKNLLSLKIKHDLVAHFLLESRYR